MDIMRPQVNMTCIKVSHDHTTFFLFWVIKSKMYFFTTFLEKHTCHEKNLKKKI
jgi:hypothetical protein